MEWDWLPEGEGLTWSTTELYEPEYSAMYDGNSVSSGKPEYVVEFIDAESGMLHGTVYLNEFHDPVGCSDFKLAEAWRELMSRVGGQTLPGDMYGRSARDYYARCSVDPRTSTAGRLACSAGGGFASLWTPETSLNTTSILTGAYLVRVFGPFTTKGVPKQLARMRKYFRFDAPHHGQGFHFDGEFILRLRNRF